MLATRTIAVFALLSSPALTQGEFVIGGPGAAFTPSSVDWSWEGGEAIQTVRDAMTDGANFGPGGVVSTTIELENLSVIDPAALAELDAFVATWWFDTETPDEAAADIIDYFLNGGSLLLYNDNSDHDKIGDLLGVPTSNSDGSVSNGGVPFFNGPFGTAENVTQNGQVGQLSAADVAATNGTVAATNASGQITAAFWNPGDYAPGAGAMLIVADVDMVATFYDDAASYNPLNDNAIFALNGISFLLGEVCDGGAASYGEGSPGSGGLVPTLDFSGCFDVGGTLSLQVTNGLGQAGGSLVFGLSQGELAIGGATLLVAPPLRSVPIILDGELGVAGAGSLSLDLVIPPAAVGQTFAQGLFVDLGATGLFSTTNGVVIDV